MRLRPWASRTLRALTNCSRFRWMARFCSSCSLGTRPSEMGVHPTHGEWEGQTYDYPRHHSIALMCDDIEATVGELRAKGAQFRGPIEQLEYGRVIMMIVPGTDDIQVYQPTHKLAYNL